VAELSTRRLQIKTVVPARNLYNIVGIIWSVLTPYMLNPRLVELEQLHRFRLGRHLLPMHRLHILPRAGASRTIVCRTRPTV
jgi:hypothetical protein